MLILQPYFKCIKFNMWDCILFLNKMHKTASSLMISRRFWHATHDCVAPYVDIILHRGRFSAKSAASGSVRWCCFRSCWTVLNHVMRGNDKRNSNRSESSISSEWQFTGVSKARLPSTSWFAATPHRTLPVVSDFNLPAATILSYRDIIAARSALGRSPSPVRWPGMRCLTISETRRSVPTFSRRS